jgi:hypothetical protein
MNEREYGSPKANDAISSLEDMIGDTVRWAETDLQPMIEEALPRSPGSITRSRPQQLEDYYLRVTAPDRKAKLKEWWDSRKAEHPTIGDAQPYALAARWVDEMYRMEKALRQERDRGQDEEDDY